ncbi:ABC transporter ATP-binding protein [Corynebacterium pacaense]|uniref:ABC transporter ATP-binding protein n=1 Tax=Corynebacterium pacaense TaxID=1816684 RepID=UPI0009BB5208|nr:ATP-binding cassette domain-containing protein [Corynebacterium pacaense]
MIVEQGTPRDLFASARQEVTRALLHGAEVTVRARGRDHTPVILNTEGISHSFGRRRKRIALRTMTLTFEEGEVLGVLGRSGSGKSTFARIIAGLDTPSTGTVVREWADGTPTKVALIAQEPYSSFDPTLTLRDSLGAAVSGLPADTADERIRGAVARVGLPPELLDRIPARCLGGQLQRMSIARALLVDPRVLICDESTSALDSVAQRHILDLLLHLNETMDLALIVISHDLDVISYVSDRVAVFHEGEVVEDRPLTEFLAAPAHPYSRRLVALSAEPGSVADGR